MDKLSSKLKDYQLQLHLPESDFQNLFIPYPAEADEHQRFAYNGDLTAMLSSHLISPLLLEYESTLRQLERELKASKLENLKHSAEIQALVHENEELSSRLEIQQREYLKIVEETRDNADLLAMRTGSLKSSVAEGFSRADASQVDELKDLRNRVHLLTEENHVLFEQITLLRSHYDKYNEEIAAKVTEADSKAASYDFLNKEFEALLQQRDELFKAKSYLEAKLSETVHMLGLVEEERRAD